MKRILRLSMLAGAIVAAVMLASVAQREASAGPLFRALTGGGYYYNGGYVGGYGAYSTYGYGPYVYGGNPGYGYSSPYGYAYAAPRAYVYPTYRSYGIGNGFGTGGTYNGVVNQTYSRSLFFPDHPPYTPYGYGAYSPYGVYVN
jgi:hypothetical protein